MISNYDVEYFMKSVNLQVVRQEFSDANFYSSRVLSPEEIKERYMCDMVEALARKVAQNVEYNEYPNPQTGNTVVECQAFILNKEELSKLIQQIAIFIDSQNRLDMFNDMSFSPLPEQKKDVKVIQPSNRRKFNLE